MNKLKILLVGVVVITYVLVAMMAPARLEVEVSTRIAFSPSIVFGHVACLDKWPNWSSWTDLDPSLKSELSEKSCGVGAWQTWSGERLGMGKRIITELNADTYIKLKVECDEVSYSGINEFLFSSDDGSTVLTWRFLGNKLPLFIRPVNLLARPVFEELNGKAIQSLKNFAEREMVSFKLYDYLVDVEKIVIPEQRYLMEISEVGLSGLDEYERNGSNNLSRYIKENGINVSGDKTLLLFEQRDTMFTIAVAFPVSEDFKVSKPYVLRTIKGGIGLQASYRSSPVSSNASQNTRMAVKRYMFDNDMNFLFPIRNIYEEGDSSNSSERLVRVIFQVEEKALIQ